MTGAVYYRAAMNGFADRASKKTIPISCVRKDAYAGWLRKQPKVTKSWLGGREFQGDAGKHELIPGTDGAPARLVVGLGDGGTLWSFGALPAALPKGRYALDQIEPDLAEAAALGWALGRYRFSRYKAEPKELETELVWPDGVDRAAVTRAAEAIYLARDLINTPAADLGPAELAGAARDLAKRHGGRCKIVKGAALERDFPAIATVGQAAARPPCLADLTWGKPKDPKVTLVGKGIVFDTGGLDLKGAANMRLMKKDMGGAACVLALAHMIMDAKLPVRLRVLLPTAENSVSGSAYRPGDILRTRKGISVEVGNTDAEGRLVLCDALALAVEDDPELIIDIATLTGAARVALGVELPALFASDDGVAGEILAAGLDPADPDPLWRMPLHRAYRRHLDSNVADISNIDNVGFGGAITAALFLAEFVGDRPWVHIDAMAWNLSDQPGRPTGGEAPGVRALFRALATRYAG
jgi:leucyl aminopeptidase